MCRDPYIEGDAIDCLIGVSWKQVSCIGGSPTTETEFKSRARRVRTGSLLRFPQRC